jgi:hypothetical protein
MAINHERSVVRQALQMTQPRRNRVHRNQFAFVNGGQLVFERLTNVDKGDRLALIQPPFQLCW